MSSIDKKIIFIGESYIKRYFVDYIESILCNHNQTAVLWFEDIHKDYNVYNFKGKIIIHIQMLQFPIDNDSYNLHVLLNTESFRVNNTIRQTTLTNKDMLIIDHSVANICDTLKANLSFSKIFHVPYQINKTEIFNLPKTKDIIMQTITTQRRADLAIPIAKKINQKLGSEISYISGWGLQRDLNTFNHKILISINSYDNMAQISCFRTDRCIFNRMIVIQEIPDKELDEGNYDAFIHPELKDLMIFEKLDNIYEKIIEVYENYDYYYHKIFDNVDFEELYKKLKIKLTDTMDSLNSICEEKLAIIAE
jgi:hypothetical protein